MNNIFIRIKSYKFIINFNIYFLLRKNVFFVCYIFNLDHHLKILYPINTTTAIAIHPIKHINNLSVYIYLYIFNLIFFLSVPSKIFYKFFCSFKCRLSIFYSIIHPIQLFNLFIQFCINLVSQCVTCIYSLNNSIKCRHSYIY